jgi:hypothetical protein
MLQHESLQLVTQDLRFGAHGAGRKGDDGAPVFVFASAGVYPEDARECCGGSPRLDGSLQIDLLVSAPESAQKASNSRPCLSRA